MNIDYRNILIKNQHTFHPVVEFDANKERFFLFDFTSNNRELTADIIEDAEKFREYIESKLKTAGCRLGIGGYAEHRTVYSRSGVFDADKDEEEPRRLHLATDIWGKAGTPVFAPLGGMVHSVAYNDQFGDYGATVVLLHQLEGCSFYTLYGHMSLRDIRHLTSGQYVVRGAEIAHFGEPHENGHWPPHLHFQVILDIGMYAGDYPGVCKYSEKEQYLKNCPDPDLILQMNRYILN